MEAKIAKLKATRKQLEELETEILNSVPISNEDMHAWAARELRLLSESIRKNADVELQTLRDEVVLADLPVISEVSQPRLSETRTSPSLVLEEDPCLSLSLDDTVFPISSPDDTLTAHSVLESYAESRIEKQRLHREEIRRIARAELARGTESPLKVVSEDDEELPPLVTATRARKGGVSLEFDVGLFR